ncbi:dTMP kinase [Corallococcus sp. bb12-1]|uniref:dTMP kinase n=1 Tax=Corallococcus sp. bb12-1 TaxID=2996784 RepID=UPI002271D771|nr:dTMP kinase [Corallococcus sp. bb12-1]MCY1042675.1 dTMP kinase [Corallococcus sp. bb12-1]
MGKLPGTFLVVEGGDGAGKTTVARTLATELAARGLRVCLTEEPSPGPVGVFLRSLLTTGPLSAEAMALLFAADRAHHSEDVILPALRRAEVVVCSRYLLSSLAYQGPEVGIERVAYLNAGARKPDLLLFLECASEVALGRAGAARVLDAFETPAVAARAAGGYAHALAYLEGVGQRVVRVDASQHPEQVLCAVLDQVLPLVARDGR